MERGRERWKGGERVRKGERKGSTRIFVQPPFPQVPSYAKLLTK